ncbi:MAG TPA: hypothetical protein VM118_14295 [Acidobacteriota bacterium]|nr:hypothetical protein [Acidobacteriota bacterium]
MSRLIFSEGASPSTPSTGTVSVYSKTDGELYKMDDTGTEYHLTPVVRATGAIGSAPSFVAFKVVDGGAGVGDILYASLKRSSDDTFDWTPIAEMP